MTAALCGLALVSAAPAADARDGIAPHAMFHVAPMARAPGFGIARGPRFEHRDRAALLDGFPEVSGPIVPCSDYNPWVSVPPYPMTCD
jgi:hypothetical protein